jgi:hypothetical protein
MLLGEPYCHFTVSWSVLVAGADTLLGAAIEGDPMGGDWVVGLDVGEEVYRLAEATRKSELAVEEVVEVLVGAVGCPLVVVVPVLEMGEFEPVEAPEAPLDETAYPEDAWWPPWPVMGSISSPPAACGSSR